jgi:hypothetical protein
MIAPLIRFAKRIVVLIPGIAMAYVAVNDLFPAVDRHLPSDALAIFVTYAITAYVLIPALLRLTRLLFKPKHIPLYCTTPDGFASDPVNVGIVGTKDELALSIILKQRYATAPFSSLYLFGRSQDIGFELPLDHNPRHRHHVRFWAASHTANPEHLDHVLFWRRFHRSNLSTGRVLWVGAASLDTGIGIIRHNAQLTHMIHPDTDAERELIIKQIKAANRLKKVRTVDLGSPYKLRNRVIMGYMKADGKMTIAELKK